MPGGAFDYDVLVVGSGFGGSVAALRLAEKGYRVAVLEAGRRYDEDTLPKTSWRLRKYLWAPRLGLRGIQRMHLVGGRAGVLVLAGAGVGGGSLVYANTLYEPPRPFFTDRQWGHITDWQDELKPYYDQARRMLGVTVNPLVTPADEAMRKVAERMGAGDTFHPTPVGVFFGERPGEEHDDPYFGGAGPRRTTCNACGSCMIGCRVGAKNMLTKNYLHLAERAGAKVIPDTTVTEITARASGGYDVRVEGTATLLKRRRTLTAEQVVLAAGTYGTQRLLHRMRATGRLPRLSPRLGELTRTNSEALLGVERMTVWHRKKDVDHSTGLAITSSFHPDDKTHIEPTRYGAGNDLMGFIRTLLIDGAGPDGGGPPRWAKFLGQAARHPTIILRGLSLKDWAKRTVIALVMQTADNSITVTERRGRLGRRRLTARQGEGEPNPTWIPIAHKTVRLLAEELDATPGGTWFDLFNIPTTAHFIGGCVIGESAETGVIDPYHRVHGHPGLHIVDGSAVTANLGVNPSLTITAQAERAMAFWPNRGEKDPRPAPGSAYERVTPVAPHAPAVPASAPGALRLL
ncbi:FAD-dependent oxidoreductase [Actinomadura fibrosa]|uniref:Cholesterol oxidase n=1 Tax=Actinomadura fibrosa TaxID=111802 RepID=A0ABW2XCT7_9ACTN|nr:GMC family oxidoreductase [Actinomadura fibrosa]